MRVRYLLGMATKRTHSSFLFRILKRSLQNFFNRSTDLLLRGIELDSASTTVHASSPGNVV